MNYGQHQSATGPGAIAGQDWFANNLRAASSRAAGKDHLRARQLRIRLDQSLPPPAGPVRKGEEAPHRSPEQPADVSTSTRISTQEAWQAASDSGAGDRARRDSLNPHFAYDDGCACPAPGVVPRRRHGAEPDARRAGAWYADVRAVAARPGRRFAVEDLGPPAEVDPVKDLADVAAGTGRRHRGRRRYPARHAHARSPAIAPCSMDDDDDDAVAVPQRDFGDDGLLPAVLHGRAVRLPPATRSRITFDDGPDPVWTPKILDVLKKNNVKATFFMIGEVAQDNVGVMQRVYREGHEIGNHTFTHPDISEISTTQVDLQLNLTERLFAAKLGVQPLYFRPPYSIDQEPDTNDQAAPVDRIQNLGYVIVGNKIDTDDWDEHPRKTPTGDHRQRLRADRRHGRRSPGRAAPSS